MSGREEAAAGDNPDAAPAAALSGPVAGSGGEQAPKVHREDGVHLPRRPLRVLDLGSHDGFVLAWLADELDGQGVDLHIDGLELCEQSAAIARRRLAERGVPGTIKQGLAESAAEHFDSGSYDAVVAFELIEHVTDPGAFLDVLESMTVPGGRVYLSTPDGCFGTGQNPNHLRVLRIVDLVDLVRRRGELQGAISGPDGVGVVAYTPEPQRPRLGDVAIYLGPAIKHWSPLDIERPGVGLGGSETAAARLAEALDALGYTVTVYAECDQGVFGQVIFRHHSTFDPLEPRRAVIASRTPHLFDRPVNAPARVLWMHDTDYGPAVDERRVDDVTSVVVLSDWHLGHVRSLYPFIEPGKLTVSANGIQPVYFGSHRSAEALVAALAPSPVLGMAEVDGTVTMASDGPESNGQLSDDRGTVSPQSAEIRDDLDVGRDCYRAIFSSSPDRGLDFLVTIWPLVRDRIPDAELVCCYADVYDAAANAQPALKAFREDLAEAIATTPGVVNLGSLSQPDLAVTMERCGLWLNPGWNGVHQVPFHETFCIGAVEAAAAGCHLVMATTGALPERANTANKFSLIQHTHPYQTAHADGGSILGPDAMTWVGAIVDAMRDEDDEPTEPCHLALEQTWTQVARDFDRLIRGA